ncbi:MAG: hypothetical protein HY645_13885 [Acidobacteria bacterium]|nr:hypothetical protein [Acidobacteriota bacterium]
MRDRLLTVSVLFILSTGMALSQLKSTPGSPRDVLPGFQYPAPKYPAYFFVKHTVEDLLPVARRYVRATYKYVQMEYRGDNTIYYYRPPRAGDVVLLVTNRRVQDPIVLEALKRAILEEGAKKVDVVYDDELAEMRPAAARREGAMRPPSAEDGWREAEVWENRALPREETENRPPTTDMLLKYYLAKHPEYTKVYAGSGGYAAPYRDALGELFAGYYFATDVQGLFSQAMPGEFMETVEKKMARLLSEASEVRITDPQGTDISWQMTPEDASAYEIDNLSGHFFLHPYLASAMPGSSVLRFPNANGVIAGTANHYGFTPHIAVHVREGKVEKVEGGGEYGERWRQWLEKTRHVQYPHFPSPGFFHLHEIALATSPKAVRAPSIFQSTIIDERRRAGMLHLSFGVEVINGHPFEKELVDFAAREKVPYGHWWHIHTYFNTVEVKNRNTGRWTKLVDKGWITLFDDPEIRKLASLYGEPEELFAYEWVPAIPGINYPGDYWKDYATDPAAWAKREFAMYKMMAEMAERALKLKAQ